LAKVLHDIGINAKEAIEVLIEDGEWKITGRKV
jgi:hypothetical protein